MHSHGDDRAVAILVTSHPGQATVDDLEGEASAGRRPRKDYVEVAKRLDADIIDSHYMRERAHPLARVVTRVVGLPAGQICEAYLRRRRYGVIFAWADRLGLPLALLFKVTRARGRLVLLSVWLSTPKKAVFLRRLRVHSHLSAIIQYSSVQMSFAAGQLDVPQTKLHLARHGVDQDFWRPVPGREENLVCSVGWEARDYATLVEAVRDLDTEVHLAVGTMVFTSSETAASHRRSPRPGGASSPGSGFEALRGTEGYRTYQRWSATLGPEGLPANVTIVQQADPCSLRALYARARFVVIPLHDVDFDAGATAIGEAMAMGKAVVLTRARGQVDLVRDGEQGLYVPPADPRALREAVEHLLRHPDEAVRMGQAGRRRVEERYRIEDFAEEMAALVRG